MGKKNKKHKKCSGCEYCENLIPIGEGDHICLECGDESVMVISEYIPTDDYLACKGKCFE